VAKRHSLKLYKEEDAIKVLSKYAEAFEEARNMHEAVDVDPLLALLDGSRAKEELEEKENENAKDEDQWTDDKDEDQWSAATHQVLSAAGTLVFEGEVTGEMERQAGVVWKNVAQRHGLDLSKKSDVEQLLQDHLEEVKREANGLRNQLLYDPNSLVSLKAKFISRNK